MIFTPLTKSKYSKELVSSAIVLSLSAINKDYEIKSYDNLLDFREAYINGDLNETDFVILNGVKDKCDLSTCVSLGTCVIDIKHIEKSHISLYGFMGGIASASESIEKDYVGDILSWPIKYNARIVLNTINDKSVDSSKCKSLFDDLFTNKMPQKWFPPPFKTLNNKTGIISMVVNYVEPDLIYENFITKE